MAVLFRRPRFAPTAAVVLLLGIIAYVAVALLNRAAGLVLIGSLSPDQLLPLSFGVIALAAGSLMIFAMSRLTLPWTWLRSTIVVLVNTAVVLVLSALAVLGVFWLLLSGANSYVRLDSHGHGNYVIAVQRWHHNSFTLYSGNGVLFDYLPTDLPVNDLDNEPFGSGNYRIEQSAGRLVLVFPSTVGGPYDVEIELENILTTP